MPFLSESITDPRQLRASATTLATHHVLIRPLALPVVPRTDVRHRVRMRAICMPAAYREAAEAIRATAVRADDVWVLGYPGSGTEAVQQLVVRLLGGAEAEVGADEEEEASRAPLLEQSSLLPHLQRSAHQRPSWERCQRLSTDRPRILRSHLPYLLLPAAMWRTQPRIVYVVRQPAETAALYYRTYRLLHGYRGTAAEFTQLWATERLEYGAQAQHEEDFVQLEADGVRNVRCVKFDVQEESTTRALVEQVARLLGVEWREEAAASDGAGWLPSRDETVRWLVGELSGERAFRAAVQRSDRHFKRNATTDFGVSTIPGIALN